jgi:cytochrome c biogenesis protein CcmG, thiol:disulfide interchange protein DsbE
MKKILLVALISFMATSLFAQADYIGKTIPSVNIKTLDGQVFNTSEIDNDGKPIVLTFWALWCTPCIRELNAISDVYIDWQDETGVKIVAVSIDDARSVPKVAPTANGNGWEYEIYLDTNGDFKRAMGVNMIPHLFLLNGDKQIVYQHTSYAEGIEEELYEIIQKVVAGADISDH